ncbi:MAG: M1 family aminopeptidase [candidate division WOR-3 bacterium]|nr:M1 family aminopeptidase [candidate division WOR-3 bacterium]
MIILVFFLQSAWQQHVSYEIYARLDTNQHVLIAAAEVVYYNNSPYTLDTLYFFLNANAFRTRFEYYAREASRMGDERFETMPLEAFGGIRMNEIVSDGDALTFNITETRLTVPLRLPVITGGSVRVTFNYSVDIPRELYEFGYWSEHYEMSHWYPKICLFDTKGWHLDPLHPLGSTYGEFGDFDVTIDLPESYLVAATGKQIAVAENILPDTPSITGDESNAGTRKIVRFLAEDVSDFIWVCDHDYDAETHKIGGTNVTIFYRSENEKYCNSTIRYATEAISRFKQWFGDYPYENLNIVDGFYEGNAAHPQMVILNLREDGVTRLFESQLVDKIALQWFGAVVGSRGSANEWLGQGLAAYATIRYMEDMYGGESSLIRTSLVPPLSMKYYHRLFYYLMHTNQLDRLVSDPASDYSDVPIAYNNSIKSKPALFFLNLESLSGRNQFDEILRRYYQDHKYKNAGSDDFVETCRNLGQQYLASLVDSFVNTTYYCDWAVNRVTGHTIEIENRGNLMIPVDMHVMAEFGEQVYHIDAQSKKNVIVVSDTLGTVTNVALDPSESTMDPEYWNNYWPRKISIKPIFNFDWPSLSTYQILWTPYLWYDTYDGVVGGLYLFGDKFADFDFVKGGYQVTAGYIYGFGSKRNYPSIRYQTPILFKDGLRARVLFGAARSRGGDDIYVGFKTNLGRPFTLNPQVDITNLITYDELSSYDGLDSIDWELGRNISVDNRFTFRHSDLTVDADISLAHHAIGSEWEYLKTTFEIQKTFESFIPFSTRLFVGKIFGDAPDQHRLFLNGLLHINWFADLLFNQSGTFSPQERLHVPGDGNMYGYQTLHIKSDQIYALNLDFPARSLVRIFADIGYYDNFAFDVGVSLVISAETIARLPLYGLSVSVNLPLYAYTPGEPWKLRWSIGLSS